MRVIYKGPSHRIRASSSSPWVKPGEEIELTERQIASLRPHHRFEPADGRQNLPEPEPEPEEAETETANEPEVVTEAAED